MRDLDITFTMFNVKQCHYELPVFYDDAGGHMAAKKGDLGKLMRSVGRIEELCRRQSVRYFEHPVPRWKGQLPKTVVNRRICRILEKVCRPRDPKACLEELGCKTHAWDAVGIGLFAKGVFGGPS